MNSSHLVRQKKEQFVSVKPGFTWGNTYEYCWMKGHIQLSEEANGKRIVMNLKPDGEATLFVNDKAWYIPCVLG